MKRLIAGMAVAALVAVFPPPIVQSTPAAQAAVDRKLDRKTATVTKSLPGYPTTSDARHQLQRSEVAVRYLDRGDVALDADVWVKGQPANYSDIRVEAWLGVLKGNECIIGNSGDRASSTLSDGRKYWLWNSDLRKTSSWNCVIVLAVDRGDPEIIHDAQAGTLKNHYISPKLGFGSVEMLRKKVKSLKLVRGSTQYHWVTIRNTGKLKAKSVVLTGKGSGMKVKKVKVGTIEPGKSETVRVPIKLTSKKKKTTTVTLTAKGSGLTVKKKLKVRAVKAPAKPKTGKWKATNSVKFTVKKGKIRDFRFAARMRCAPPGGFATYKNVTLTFPATKIPRHGYVEATKNYRKGNAWYSAGLKAKVVGGKLTQGRYSYFTAGSCSVVEGFTAKR